MRLPDYPIPDQPVRASWGRMIVDYLRSITPRSSTQISVCTSPSGTTFLPYARHSAGGADSFPWEKLAFGFKINPDGDDPLEVKIFSGRIGSLEVPEGTVVLPDMDGTWWVWLRRTRSDDTCVFQRGSAWPTDSGTYQYFVLYEFIVAEGAATLGKVRRPLDRDLLKIDGTGSPYQVFQINSAGDAVVVDWLRWA